MLAASDISMSCLFSLRPSPVALPCAMPQGFLLKNWVRNTAKAQQRKAAQESAAAAGSRAPAAGAGTGEAAHGKSKAS